MKQHKLTIVILSLLLFCGFAIKKERAHNFELAKQQQEKIAKQREVAKELALRNRIVRIANSQIGKAWYVWGGSTPAGFDCTGFGIFSWNGAGIPIDRQTIWTKVEATRNELKPGDIIVFSEWRTKPTHVGIYIGDGKFTHAMRPGTMVKIDELDSYWAPRIIGKVNVKKIL